MEAQFPENSLIYGAGGFGQRLVQAMRGGGLGIEGVIDERFTESSGTEFRLEDAPVSGKTVILGISNPHTDLSAIRDDLLLRGASRVMTPVQAVSGLGIRGVTLENYWMTSDLSIYETNEERIQQARSLLSDDKSIRLFDQILDYRRGGRVEDAPKPDALNFIYAPTDLPFITNSMRIVDAGAYDGDSIKAMESWPGSIDSVIALEPDPMNYAKLVQAATQSTFDVASIPVGIGSRSELLRFSSSGEASAAFDESGNITVPVVALDDLCLGWRPTHIKMDIEGAEPFALEGMQRILKKYRPALAISVYHSPHHHWELLLEFEELNLSYKYFLRVYGEQTFDTVLYCIPEQS